jgi:hypothetical protein
MEIFARVKRGTNAGVVLHPHLHKDGTYVVSKTRFEKDYIRVESLQEVMDHVAQGYSVRMSNLEAGVPAASLVSPGSISTS